MPDPTRPTTATTTRPAEPDGAAGLARYAERLLSGTGLDADAATDAASGRRTAVPPHAEAAAAALRDGWTAAAAARPGTGDQP